MSETTVVENKVAQAQVETKTVQPKVETKRVLKPVAPQPKVEQPKAAKLLEVKGKKVRATFTVKANEEATNDVACDVTFDFSQCSEEDVLKLATASVRISYQAQLRRMGDAEMQRVAKTTQVVDVQRDILNAARQSVDETTKAVRALARASGMSEQDARKHIERLMKK